MRRTACVPGSIVRHQRRPRAVKAAPLAAAGFRVVAPDMRGYNLSSKPDGGKAYDTGPLTADIRGLIHERGVIPSV